MTKYVPIANIMDDHGNKSLAGTPVELSAALAKHYTKLGLLRPHFDDDDEDEVSNDAAKVSAILAGKGKPAPSA